MGCSLPALTCGYTTSPKRTSTLSEGASTFHSPYRCWMLCRLLSLRLGLPAIHFAEIAGTETLGSGPYLFSLVAKDHPTVGQHEQHGNGRTRQTRCIAKVPVAK